MNRRDLVQAVANQTGVARKEVVVTFRPPGHVPTGLRDTGGHDRLVLELKPGAVMLDLSMNETLSRTILTGITTLMALAALYMWGGEVISSFTIAMIFGILVGTYSSIFVAGPLLILFRLRSDVFDAKTGPVPAAAQPSKT